MHEKRRQWYKYWHNKHADITYACLESRPNYMLTLVTYITKLKKQQKCKVAAIRNTACWL